MRGADFMQMLNSFYPSTRSSTLKAYTLDLVHKRTYIYYTYMYQIFDSVYSFKSYTDYIHNNVTYM